MLRGKSLSLGALFAFLSFPGGAAAQACIGLPQGTNGALGASVGFPEDGTSYGLSGSIESDESGLFFTGGFGLTSYDEEILGPIDNEATVRGEVAFEVSSLAPGASLCPMGGIVYSWLEDLNLLSIPFGIGFGTTLPVGRSGTAGLTPYVIPQFVHVRLSVDEIDGTDSDTQFGLAGGVTLHAGSFIIGSAASRIFEDEADTVISVFVGAAWP